MQLREQISNDSSKIKRSAQLAFVLFGSTGDLATGKIIPSLFLLYKNKQLTRGTRIFCIGRRAYTDKEYKEFLIAQLKLQSVRLISSDMNKLAKFLRQITYISGDPTQEDTYIDIKKELSKVYKKGNISIVSYLAVPQDLHVSITKNLKNVLFSTKRYQCLYIAIEKPFGYDQKTARLLYKQITSQIVKEHIVLIDHYLYKWPIVEMAKKLCQGKYKQVTGVSALAYIKKIHVMAEETKKVEHRLDFYDKVGAFRDVGQNHVMQMLVAFLSQGKGAQAKIKVLKELSFVGTPVFKTYKGYKGTPTTDTYFSVELKSNNKLWDRTRIIISGGKGLAKNKSGIEIVDMYGKETFINANKIDTKKQSAYEVLLIDLLYGEPKTVSIEEISLAWRICEIIKDKHSIK